MRKSLHDLIAEVQYNANPVTYWVFRVINRLIRKKVKCKRCKIPMTPGKAILQTYTGLPDFPGKEVVTMSPGGPGKLIDCLKCPKCGYSVTKGE